MQRIRLFCRSLTEGLFALSPEEAHHAASVLRRKPGHNVLLFDGEGREAAGAIERIESRGRSVQTWVRAGPIRVRPFDLGIKLTLAVAMPKPHRQGYLIEKCTELGVAAIWPVLTARSVSRPRAASVEKWKRRAVEAAKQAARAWVPAIEPAISLSECLQRVAEFDAASISCLGPRLRRFDEFLKGFGPGRSVLVLVGPEGGWTEDERNYAVDSGAVATVLSPTVLRTETAAVAVCAAVAGLCAGGGMSNGE
ncbi:MAG: RsmE family RNA methyltransferase [Phycisphaerae bacterium]|jgi:16S rRNA (uracil1498-N3)-methyltransferase